MNIPFLLPSFFVTLCGTIPFLETAQGAEDLTTKPHAISWVGTESLKIPRSDSVPPGQHFLIIRPVPDDDPEVIANGILKGHTKKESVISFDPVLVKKRPTKTDLVIFLGKPKVFIPPPKTKNPGNLDFAISEIENTEAGYLQIKYIQSNIHLDSTSPNQANSLKKLANFPRTGVEFEWLMEFLPNYGFSFGLSSGQVPITDYFHRPVPGQFDQSFLKLIYRTEKKSNFRGQLFLQSLGEKFTTENKDEYVLGTQLDVNALGAALIYERGPLLPITPTWSYSLTAIKFNYLYGFSVIAQDGEISRGESQGGNFFQEIRVSLDTTGYFPKIPYLKRWIFGIEFYQRSLELQFSGKTKGEVISGGYVIPSGEKYSEEESGIFLSLGFRFEDVVGRAFKPRD